MSGDLTKYSVASRCQSAASRTIFRRTAPTIRSGASPCDGNGLPRLEDESLPG